MGQRDDNDRTELAVNPLYVMEGMEALKASNLFGPLNGTELKTLFQAGERRPFQEGEELILPGDPLDALWVIVTGRVEISQGDERREQGVAGFFGESALVRTTTSRMDCKALGEGEALRFTRSSLVKLTREQPRLGVKLLWALLENAYKPSDGEPA